LVRLISILAIAHVLCIGSLWSADQSLIPAPIDITNVASGGSRTINVADDLKDFSPFIGAKIIITNTGEDYCRIEAWLNESWKRLAGGAHLEPGETRDLTIHFRRHEKHLGNVAELWPGMRGIPGGTVIHWADINYATDAKSFLVRVFSEENSSIRIDDIVAYGEYRLPQEMAAIEGFFPFIDVYGQYKHDDWPGKTYSDADLQAAIVTENADLEANPAPADRNEFGGWMVGPKLDATGHFRVEKVEDKWWFVDPAGRLFWSFGTTGIRQDGGSTKTEERENFFENLPDISNPVYGSFVNPYDAQFDGRTYGFADSNLYRKYGSDWEARTRDNSLRRLKSWGLNTMGNWSSSFVYRHDENRTPYTVAVHFWSNPIDSSVDIPDPYHPDFRTRLNNGLSNTLGASVSDPYCLGFFIGNEIRFHQNGVDNYITNGFMKQSASAPGKVALIDFLKSKYTSISQLNSAWNTSYSNWTSLESVSAFPDSSAARADGLQWEEVFADKLYRTYNEEARNVAPEKLYLGSRFLRITPSHIMESAAPHVDVISINYYQVSPDDIPLTSLDKPIIIGEFHFGAIERGYFNIGLRGVGTQADRAESYRYYYRDALRHPRIIGAHWFQYRAQVVTGRKDGENYQIGMLDVCDNPYPELREAARAVGKSLYYERAGVEPLQNSGFHPEIDVVGDSERLVLKSEYTDSGRTYLIEHSTDPTQQDSWSVVDTFVSSGDEDFEGQYPLNPGSSFYRVRVELLQL
jgi:hypothetical protein